MFFYYSNNGLVKFASEEMIEADLPYIEVPMTEELSEQMEAKYTLKVTDGNLEAERSLWLENFQREQARDDLVNRARNNRLTMEDVSNFIRDFL